MLIIWETVATRMKNVSDTVLRVLTVMWGRQKINEVKSNTS